MSFGKIEKDLLKEIADLESIPQGAYNIRDNGKLAGRNVTANIDIRTKTDKPGIDIFIKSATKGERVDIPVILTETGLDDLVYNDFYVEDGADVTIVAGCGIHNAGGLKSEHDGIHSFHIGKGAKVMYVNASSLNLRAEPSMVGELLMRLQANQRVIVLEVCDDPEWVHVKTDVVEGYCMVSYLAEEGVKPTPTAQ